MSIDVGQVSTAFFIFFFNDPATTEIYTLSLHDALPICRCSPSPPICSPGSSPRSPTPRARRRRRSSTSSSTLGPTRSEEHTSELQSRQYLVCRLLLEKKKDFRHEVCLLSNAADTVLSHI